MARRAIAQRPPRHRVQAIAGQLHGDGRNGGEDRFGVAGEPGDDATWHGVAGQLPGGVGDLRQYRGLVGSLVYLLLKCLLGLRSRSAPEEGGEPVAGACCCPHGDWRCEQRVPAGAGDQRGGYLQQAGSQGARDRLALSARPGYVPPVDSDLEGGRGGYDAGRQRAAGDLNDLTLVAGGGPGIEQLAGAIAEGAGRVGRQVCVLGGRLEGNASGFDALADRGQGFAGVPEQHPQVPAPAWRRARQ
jgi:hypothetical protein